MHSVLKAVFEKNNSCLVKHGKLMPRQLQYGAGLLNIEQKIRIAIFGGTSGLFPKKQRFIMYFIFKYFQIANKNK
jgi:hypothetical protein